MDSIELKDSMGVEINVGDTVAYATLKGMKPFIATAKVKSINAAYVNLGTMKCRIHAASKQLLVISKV